MTPLNVNLQRLIEAIDTEMPSAAAIDKVTEAQQRARSLTEIGDQLVDHFVTKARTDGASWSHIGDALGVSKQAAQQRWVPPLFQLFTDRARYAVVLAQEAARTLRHEHIGSEHLLNGLLDIGGGLARDVLEKLAGEQRIREALAAVAPPGEANPPAKIPMTEHAKSALGHTNAIATALGHNYVGTEHILLALTQVPASKAGRVLADLGIDHDTALRSVTEALATFLARNPEAAARVEQARERAAAAGIELKIAGA